MAGLSHYHYHKNDEDDAEFESLFEELLEIPEMLFEPKNRKNVFLLKDTGKKATSSYGMIIFLKLLHILPIYSADGFE